MNFSEFVEASSHGALNVNVPKNMADFIQSPVFHKMDHDFGLVSNWNGEIEFSTSPYNTMSKLVINPSKKTISTHDPKWEFNPYTVSILDVLSKYAPLKNFVLHIPNETIPLPSIQTRIKSISGHSPTWARPKYDFKSSMKRFGLRIIKEIWEQDFYHASFKKHVSQIMKEGLTPSMTLKDVIDKFGKNGSITLGDIPTTGWTSMPNEDRQPAVYLWSERAEAKALAEYLSYRNNETAVLIKVDGRGIKDYTKLVIDEDALRDNWGDVSKRFRSKIPHFYGSVLATKTIGYLDKIYPQYLSVIEEIDRTEEED